MSVVTDEINLGELTAFLQDEIQKQEGVGELTLTMFLNVTSVLQLQEEADEKVETQQALDLVSNALLTMSSFYASMPAEFPDRDAVNEVIEAFVNFLPEGIRLQLVAQQRQWMNAGQFLSGNMQIYEKGSGLNYDLLCIQYATFPNSCVGDHLSPGYISVVKNTQGVIDTLQYPDFAERKFAIRTGGHQYCGYSTTTEENVLIDVARAKPFNEYEYNAKTNILFTGVSHSLEELLIKNNNNSIFLPTGICSLVYVGGHVHTGGIGQFARSMGLFVDYVMGFRTIMADGTKLLVVRPTFLNDPQNGELIKQWQETSGFEFNEQLNDDMFFATLGGSAGGDFGVMTGVYFQPARDRDFPHPVGWMYIWEYSKEKLLSLCEKMAELTVRAEQNELIPDFDAMITIFQTDMEPVHSDDSEPQIKPYFRGSAAVMTNETFPDEKPRAVIFLSITVTEMSDEASVLVGELEAAGNPHGRCIFNQKKTGFALSALTRQFQYPLPREFPYPYVRGARATKKLLQPKNWAKSMTDYTDIVIQSDNMLIASQFQILGGSSKFSSSSDIAMPGRDASIGVTYPVFYKDDAGRQTAEHLRGQMEEAWIGANGVFSDVPFRYFAFTWGNRDLNEIWKAYYMSDELYQQIRGIKGAVDPYHRFNSSTFSVS